MVTNGEATQAEKDRLAGVVGMVNAVCISSLVGARKPSAAIFAEAARRCEVPLGGWMVGDSPEADIRGGRNAGLTTIWLHRGRAWPLADVRPDFTVATIRQAGDIIAAASATGGPASAGALGTAGFEPDPAVPPTPGK